MYMTLTTLGRSIAIGMLLLLVIQFIALVLLGQPLICECGYVKLWHGVVLSGGNSQHLSDWYTPSHVIHGILFYALLWLIAPKLSHGKRLLIALGIEVGWEIIENTPMVINQYREQALAQGYTGDSIINSMMDSVAMLVGFLVAKRSPVAFSILAVIALEIFVGFAIHDNLTLNILNFIHPIDAVTEWQMR